MSGGRITYCFVEPGELLFVPMQIQDLAKAYEAKTDEELLQLATESEQLTPEAHAALNTELAKRRIDSTRHLKVREESQRGWIEQSKTHGTPVLGDSDGIAEFLAEVLRVYHDQFWLYVKLTAPSVVVGGIAVFIVGYEVREIAHPLSQGVEHNAETLEILLVRLAGCLVGWMAVAFSFGAICVTIRQIAAGVVPSVADAFTEVHERTAPLLRLSLLLFFLLLVVFAAAGALSVSIAWILLELHVHPSRFTIFVFACATVGSAILVFSRFVLAIPAVVLDNCKVGQAIFRSDELAQGKWLTLAALLAKSLIGGYLAGMCPFWLASWIPANVPLPSWFPWILAVASIAGVTVVEPTMLIGFALLYSRVSALSSTSSEPGARRLA